ncbi:MAG TPA: VCBS repeat-containing protein [Thermoanaerobaculia bacterium]|nr:VCBS repeat-containing protein [Thermoanaerobaculia bacterium]
MVVADFDNDGRLDVASTYIFAGQIGILLQAPDGSFSFFNLFSSQGTPTALVAADFNRDGTMDLADATVPKADEGFPYNPRPDETHHAN